MMAMSESKEYVGIDELEHLEEGLPSWFNAKSKEVARLLEGRRLLDVGCGIGTFTRVFVREGFEVVGTDMSQECLDRAKGIKAKFFKEDICKLTNLRKFQNYFDSVVALDVIEHIRDDALAVKNIRSLLKMDGAFILTVPAYSFLYSEHDAKIGHHRRYSSNSIRKLLVDNGFKIERIFYWNLPGVFGWGACKAMKKNPAKTASKKIDGLYRVWFSLEGRIRFPIGLTIFVKARKI